MLIPDSPDNFYNDLTDPFGRHITYLRLSVTDRCDFRCRYCMAEEMTFLPKKEILSLEEAALIARAFVELGVKKIRLTGGEPLIRHNFTWLVEQIGRLPRLRELAITTNASHLDQVATQLVDAGVKRINISLDSLDHNAFRNITRVGDLNKVLRGIDAAIAAGFERIKINAVILKGFNEDQVLPLLDFCLERGLDISYIEEMPLGNIDDHSRRLAFISSAELRDVINSRYELIPTTINSGGPSRYWTVNGSSNRIGFISPHSENFCATCNRVRVTVKGQLLWCLGHENAVDLRAIIRANPGQVEPVKQAILQGIVNKPERHQFTHDDEPQVVRFMNMTGG